MRPPTRVIGRVWKVLYGQRVLVTLLESKPAMGDLPLPSGRPHRRARHHPRPKEARRTW